MYQIWNFICIGYVQKTVVGLYYVEFVCQIREFIKNIKVILLFKEIECNHICLAWKCVPNPLSVKPFVVIDVGFFVITFFLQGLI